MARKRVKALTPPKRKSKPNQPPAVRPTTKKDGTPWTPWADEVALRLQKKAERIAASGGVEDRTGLCTAHTSGIHGPKRLCGKYAVGGLTVCATHGGSTKAAKEAAKKRLLDELNPTISRLIELRDQDAHLPTALGAATHMMNRVLGKPDSVDKDKGAGRPVINVGIAIGGIPARGTAQIAIDDGNTVDSEATEVDD